MRTYVFLHVVLPSGDCALPNLHSNLRGRIVHPPRREIHRRAWLLVLLLRGRSHLPHVLLGLERRLLLRLKWVRLCHVRILLLVLEGRAAVGGRGGVSLVSLRRPFIAHAGCQS